MEIFSKEFKNWLKRITACTILGHKEGKWAEEWWALGHTTGHMVKHCERCHLELDRKDGKYNSWKEKGLIE